MNITPALDSTLTTAQYTTPTSTNSKLLTNEIEEPVQFALSGEGILVSELAARAPEGYKAPKFSQASIKALEFDIIIMQQMKSQRLAGESSGNNIKDLAIAYDTLLYYISCFFISFLIPHFLTLINIHLLSHNEALSLFSFIS